MDSDLTAGVLPKFNRFVHLREPLGYASSRLMHLPRGDTELGRGTRDYVTYNAFIRRGSDPLSNLYAFESILKCIEKMKQEGRNARRCETSN